VTIQLLVGDCRDVLKTLPYASVQCCVTSPPYFGLRDYGVDGQIGLESTVEAYVAELVAVFREVRRVLRDDGTLWLVLGDSYAGSWGNQGRKNGRGTQREINGPMLQNFDSVYPDKQHNTGTIRDVGLKPKDLIGVPWRVAFALQNDGWYLRSDIIWAKPNPMPEPVRDRPTKSHEYIFLLTKSVRYYWDADAVKEPTKSLDPRELSYRPNSVAISENGRREFSAKHTMSARAYNPAGRNIRSVWTIATSPYKDAHFATFPPDLAERCIKAGSKEGDVVLDPFGGAGTTGLVADRLGRNAILIELNPDYTEMARKRIIRDAPLFAQVT